MIDVTRIGEVLAARLAQPLEEARSILEEHTGNSSASADALDRIADSLAAIALLIVAPRVQERGGPVADRAAEAFGVYLQRIIDAAEEEDNGDDAEE